MPKCDFCNNDAVYDGKTVKGPWAYMCEKHFAIWGSRTKGFSCKLVDFHIEEEMCEGFSKSEQSLDGLYCASCERYPEE